MSKSANNKRNKPRRSNGYGHPTKLRGAPKCEVYDDINKKKVKNFRRKQILDTLI